VKTLTKRPSNEDFLFPIRTTSKAGGDVSGSRPGMLDMVGRAKYDGWAKLKGMSKDDCYEEICGESEARC